MLDHHINGRDEAVMTNHQLNQLPTAGVDEYIITIQNYMQITIQNLCPEYLRHFQKQWQETPVIMLASTPKRRDTIINI